VYPNKILPKKIMAIKILILYRKSRTSTAAPACGSDANGK